MTLAFWSCLLAFALGVGVERLAARPGASGIAVPALPVRFGLFGLMYLFWLGIWGRPVLAGVACVVTLGVMTGISIRKRQLVGEPLSFSDFGLLGLIVRHPDLYYTEFMVRPPFLAAATAFLVSLGLWLWVEPAYRVLSGWQSLGAASGVVLATALVWRAAPLSGPAGLLRRMVPVPDVETHIARWGLLLTLVAYALRWRAEIETPYDGLPDASPDLTAAASVDPTLVVIVQFESFVDPVRLGLSDGVPPGLAKARERARFHGPLRVPAHGAFTMRSEHAVLTGLSDADLGFRAVDPYLARRGPAPSTIATRLARRGYRTLFIHPFRAGFFGRDVVVPRLGFETLIFEEGFAGAERFGPYVSDRAMARRILDEADRSAGAPTLVTAITMENHGPWTPERLPHEPDPTRQYLEHLRNADAAIEMLIDGLSRRPGRTLLCFFGDHPPILPGIVPSAAPETDYAVLVFGDGQPLSASPARRLTADALGRLLVKLCGAADAPPGAGALGREPEASLSRG